MIIQHAGDGGRGHTRLLGDFINALFLQEGSLLSTEGYYTNEIVFRQVKVFQTIDYPVDKCGFGCYTASKSHKSIHFVQCRKFDESSAEQGGYTYDMKQFHK